MNRSTTLSLIMATLLFLGGAAFGVTYTFTTLDDPLAPRGSHNGTRAIGISGGTVAGWYNTSSGIVHGFRETGGVYTTLDAPSANAGTTTAYGVSGNTVVGYFSNNTGYHGFTETDGVYTTLEVPAGWNSNRTFAHGIDGTTVVGSYGLGDGFIESGAVYTQLDCPYATGNNRGTTPLSVSGDTVVGYYTNATGDHGFVETPDGPYNTIWTTLDDPLATGGTYAYGLSENTVVGYYIDGAGSHGFLETGGAYTTLDLPSAVGQTLLLGISGNDLVGTYWDTDGTVHGFLATPEGVPEPASLTLLALGGGFLRWQTRWRSRGQVHLQANEMDQRE